MPISLQLPSSSSSLDHPLDTPRLMCKEEKAEDPPYQSKRSSNEEGPKEERQKNVSSSLRPQSYEGSAGEVQNTNPLLRFWLTEGAQIQGGWERKAAPTRV